MNYGVGPDGYFEKHYLSRDWRFYLGIVSLIIRTAEPGPILDLGAGVGYFVEACRRWGLRCTGLEGSKRAVEIARSRSPGLSIEEFLLSDALPFEADSFSAVLMNQVIEHLEQPIADHCVQESFRVLRPGGILVIFSPSKYNKAEKQNDPTHINMFSPKELRLLLESKGFRSLEPNDSPLPLLGRNRLGRLIMKAFFQIARHDRLSATANCIALKPAVSRIDELLV